MEKENSRFALFHSTIFSKIGVCCTIHSRDATNVKLEQVFDASPNPPAGRRAQKNRKARQPILFEWNAADKVSIRRVRHAICAT